MFRVAVLVRRSRWTDGPLLLLLLQSVISLLLNWLKVLLVPSLRDQTAPVFSLDYYGMILLLNRDFLPARGTKLLVHEEKRGPNNLKLSRTQILSQKKIWQTDTKQPQYRVLFITKLSHMSGITAPRHSEPAHHM